MLPIPRSYENFGVLMRNKEKEVVTRPSRGQPHSTITLVMFMALLLGMAALTGIMIYSYVLALVMGGILALLSYPIYRKLTLFRFPEKIAAGIATVGMVFLVVIPISFFVFLAVEQGVILVNELGSNEEFSFQTLIHRITHWSLIEKAFGSPAAAQQQIREWIQGIGTAVIGTTVTIVAITPQILLQIALALISYFFFLLDGKQFISWLANRIPLESDVRKKVATSFNETTISVIWATLATALVQAAIMFIAFLVLAVPAVFLAAAATFIFAWIPILGSAPVWLAGTLYLYLQGFYIKAILMIVFGLVTSVSDNLVRPLILNGKAKMHPLISLVAIFGGIGMFGIFGVFIGPIIAAILISLLQIWPAIAKRFGLMSSSSA